MQPVVLEGMKKELLVETASSESNNDTPGGRDGPSSEEVADPDRILRNQAQGRVFPGTSSWFDGKHKH